MELGAHGAAHLDLSGERKEGRKEGRGMGDLAGLALHRHKRGGGEAEQEAQEGGGARGGLVSDRHYLSA